MWTQSQVIHEIANERQFLGERSGLLPVEPGFPVDFERWKQMKVIGTREVLSPREQSLGNVPRVARSRETNRLILRVPFRFEAIRKVGPHSPYILWLTLRISRGGQSH